jgi:hypothetical protein
MSEPSSSSSHPPSSSSSPFQPQLRPPRPHIAEQECRSEPTSRSNIHHLADFLCAALVFCAHELRCTSSAIQWRRRAARSRPSICYRVGGDGGRSDGWRSRRTRGDETIGDFENLEVCNNGGDRRRHHSDSDSIDLLKREPKGGNAYTSCRLPPLGPALHLDEASPILLNLYPSKPSQA